MTRRFRLFSISLLVLLIMVSCDFAEPLKFAGFTLSDDIRPAYPATTEAICHAIEDAGYLMPYGTSLSWYDFSILQSSWELSGPNGSLITLPSGQPSIFILVDRTIPVDWNSPDLVSQKTVDLLARDAKKICQIVQQEANKHGIGPIKVRIRLWDLFVGAELEYGLYDPQQEHEYAFQYTAACEKMTGFFIGKSNGLNPDMRTPDRCPSLYVPN
jgi:hypothetical protein